mmetsp:Transcript_33741/g.96783  ORF Transcript_33741/g.96783 Transcript_33741/m.96783 type:complete len:322 (-) Transcript_33741:113-1078(-)
MAAMEVDTPAAIGVGGGGADGTAPEATAAVPEEWTGPKSTSSAMPDHSSPSVPCLRAKVHQILSAAECQMIPLSALRFRPVEADDHKEMVALHTEWFPVTYDEGFYTKCLNGEIFTIAATYTASGGAHGSSASSSASPSAGSGEAEEHLLGLITMSTSCDFHGDDIGHVLGADCDALCRSPPGSIAMPCGRLAYILTLGVTDGFRRRGLAKELLKRSVMHVHRNMLHVDAIYLHVVSYNEPAIHLYESSRFMQINKFVAFYQLHGKPYDSLLYAYYLHEGRPPWKLRIKNMLSAGREWVVSAWCSMWGAEQQKQLAEPAEP